MTVLDDRRATARAKFSKEVEWAGSSGRLTGTISDIGPGGCFVLSGGVYDDGEIVRLYFPLSDGMKVEFMAEISNHEKEIGFAARFVDMTRSQREFLSSFIAMYQDAD
ncbi:MAG: PilZ domain-containing protein [Blastocatellia bacterium]|nr:PilZ domain-containing protein [Blastocatellia bacterium]